MRTPIHPNDTLAKNPESMSDEELIEAVATQVMGWGFRVKVRAKSGKKSFVVRKSFARKQSFISWNPLTDWNLWRHVEEKIMSDSRLEMAFANVLTDYLPRNSPLLIGFETMFKTYGNLNLRTRCLAALKAISLTNHD